MTKLEAQLFENIRPLKQEERLQARQNAREHVKALAGNRPTRERYVGHTISDQKPYRFCRRTEPCPLWLLA